jgi:hypothetical protein
MNNNDKTFIGWAISECVKEGIAVHLITKPYLEMAGGNCVGYFCEGDKELCVASKVPFKSFFPIFLHEFCHFKQWQTEEPLFVKLSKNSDLDNDMWDWINGIEISKSRVKKSIRAYRQMELNCEKRAVKYIDEFGLSIDKDWYIKAANVYVLFYGIIEETRKWYKYAPYNDKLLDLVPGHFIRSFKIPNGFRERILEEII